MSIAHLELILANRRPHEVQAGVRFTTLERAVAEFKAMADRVCNCEQPAGFQIDTRRNNGPLDAEFMLNNMRRMEEHRDAKPYPSNLGML